MKTISNTIQKIDDFFNCGAFHSELNDTKSILNEIERKIVQGEEIKLVYGETYDKYGLTVDSMKYYFILNILKSLIEDSGASVEANLIIGDVASTRNQDAEIEKINGAIETNIKEISRLIQKYNLEINQLLMSDLFRDDKFKRNYDLVTKEFIHNSELQNIFRDTVLQNRLKQEIDSQFQYSREEVALIMDYDLKIGPPREQKYDNAAKLVSRKELLGLYIKPTYPLGKNFAYFINHPEVEKYGLTPYKAGSNRLNAYRVLVNETNVQKVDDLIQASFLSDDPSLPNPILDLYIIGDLARRISQKDYSFKGEYKVTKEIKESTSELVSKFLLN